MQHASMQAVRAGKASRQCWAQEANVNETSFHIETWLSRLQRHFQTFSVMLSMELGLEDNLELQPRFSLARQVHATRSVEAKSFSCSSQLVTALPSRAMRCTSPLCSGWQTPCASPNETQCVEESYGSRVVEASKRKRTAVKFEHPITIEAECAILSSSSARQLPGLFSGRQQPFGQGSPRPQTLLCLIHRGLHSQCLLIDNVNVKACFSSQPSPNLCWQTF